MTYLSDGLRMPSKRTQALLLAVVILLAGCSGGDVGSTVTVEGTTDSPTTSAPTVSAPTATSTTDVQQTAPASTTHQSESNPSTQTQTSAATTATTTRTAVTSTTVSEASGTLKLHFINVGQSVSTLIESPSGETMLIDTGHFQDDGEHVIDYLRDQGITRLDHLVTSHNDADHIGGNAQVIEYFETEADGIGAVYDPGIAAGTQTYEEYLDAVEQYDVQLFEVREGDQLPFEGVDVQVLGPPEPYIENEARNENSIVLKFTHGETSFMMSGDAEDDQEAYLVDNYGSALEATVLKAGHHGSSSSSSPAFLDAVSPQVVVISSAYDSRYGHPTPEVLDRLADRSIPTYWTGTHGHVVFESDGETVSVSTQRAAPTDARSLRDGSATSPETDGEVSVRLTVDGTATATPLPDGGETPTSTQTTTTAPSAGALAVERVHADAAGTERENLNDEYIVFTNTGDSALDLGGWTVRDAADHEYRFPAGTTLDAGATLTLRTGSGTDTTTDVYWNSGSPIWNNGGDTIFVENSEGTLVLEEEY